MSKHLKLLEKLCANPPPASFKWSDLKVVLEHLGFKMLMNSGSRRKFQHAEKDVLIICHEPHPSPEVDRGCIVDVVETLKANGFVEN
jgi:predicted RNA binding protein YcfA (HicA-like mRNA interferase family)